MTLDCANVAVSEKLRGTVAGVQFAAVFQSPETGFRFGTLPQGPVFRIINNPAATPITGTFANLADGQTFIQSGNTYTANYEGEDGNDLILAVQ